MKRRLSFFLSAAMLSAILPLSGCSGTDSAPNSTLEGTGASSEITVAEAQGETSSNASARNDKLQEMHHTMPNGRQVYAYLPDSVMKNPDKKVPMVLALHCTGGDPAGVVNGCGWADEAVKENFIVVAPSYDSYDSTYNETDFLASVVEYAVKTYPVDPSRVYSTGFSNGGAASVSLCRDYPQLFAAIASMGWMVDMDNANGVYEKWDMPFQVIQGTKEYTYATGSGAMAVMEDEQRAIRALMLYNEMIDDSVKADYDQTPYWGYKPDDVHTVTHGGRNWQIGNYYKDGYQAPFAQLVLIDGTDHRENQYEASTAWDFLRHYARGKDGSVVERTAE